MQSQSERDLDEMNRTFEEWLQWTIDEESTFKFRDFLPEGTHYHAKIVYDALMAERREDYLNGKFR